MRDGPRYGVNLIKVQHVHVASYQVTLQYEERITIWIIINTHKTNYTLGDHEETIITVTIIILL